MIRPVPPVAAVSDHGGPAHGVLCSGQLPCLAVVAIPWDRPADGDDQTCVGVDDDLVVGGVPVVLRLLGDRVVTGGDQGAVDNQYGVPPEPLARLQGEQRPEMGDDPVRGGLGNPEQRSELPQGEVRPLVRSHQQDSVFQRQAPGATSAHRVSALPPQRGHELPELSRAQPGKRGYPGGFRRRDYTSHGGIVSP